MGGLHFDYGMPLYATPGIESTFSIPKQELNIPNLDSLLDLRPPLATRVYYAPGKQPYELGPAGPYQWAKYA